MEKKEEYYPYFDYLRILLASIVMLYHDHIVRWPHSGRLAVDVFFALSGWLIGGILLRLSREALPRFYFNRAMRIWIPYGVALLLIMAASLLKDPIDGKWLEFTFYKSVFVYNIFGTPQLAEFRDRMPLDGTGNHFWSVNAEEQFYLLSPLILVLMPKLGRTAAIWCILAILAWTLNIYAPISFGVLAAVLANRYGDFYSTRIAKSILLLMTVGAALGLANGERFELYSPVFAIGVVMLSAIRGKKHRLGEFLGGMSYPLYLNHWIGVFTFNALLSPVGLRDSGIRQLLAMLLNLGVAALLYWHIDHRILPMRGRLFTKKRGAIVIYSAYGFIILGIAVGMILTVHRQPLR